MFLRRWGWRCSKGLLDLISLLFGLVVVVSFVVVGVVLGNGWEVSRWVVGGLWRGVVGGRVR